MLFILDAFYYKIKELLNRLYFIMNKNIEDAQLIFQEAMVNQGIDKLKIKDNTGEEIVGINLKAMALPDMWLPQFMIRADNVALFLCKQRMFDVAYMKDSNTLTGMRPTDVPDDNVKEYNYQSSIIEGVGLRTLIINHALNSAINNAQGFAKLNKYIDLSNDIPNSEYIGLMNGELLIASLLNDFTNKAKPVLEKTLSLNHSNKFEI